MKIISSTKLIKFWKRKQTVDEENETAVEKEVPTIEEDGNRQKLLIATHSVSEW